MYPQAALWTQIHVHDIHQPYPNLLRDGFLHLGPSQSKVQRGAPLSRCTSLSRISPVSGREQMNSHLSSQMARHHFLLMIPIVNSEILLAEPKVVARSPCEAR